MLNTNPTISDPLAFPIKPDWPHSPPHRILQKGTYMVTAGTYQKVHHYNSHERLKFLQNLLLKFAIQYDWHLQVWAISSNHYHFIAESPEDPTSLSNFISHLHVEAAKYVNLQDGTPNRKVWWQYWDSHITYQYSYFARLNYVNQNPVLHGLVKTATDYPWCSASWFEKNTSPAF